MPRYIMKADKDHDLYVEWSTVVDAPIGWGPKEYLRSLNNERLERCDATGTSMHPSKVGDETFHEGSWDDDGMIVHNMGTKGGFYWLERNKLYDFIAAIDSDPENREVQQAALDAHTREINDDEE